jgi:hypothetical protein
MCRATELSASHETILLACVYANDRDGDKQLFEPLQTEAGSH